MRYIQDDLQDMVELKQKARDEDERIRKALINGFNKLDKSAIWYNGITNGKILAWLEKQDEPKEYTFKSLPRLFDMIEPTSKAKAYCQKLIDTLAKEGYTTDAKIIGGCLKTMNGENVPMAIMDEKQGEQKPAWSEEDKKILKDIITDVKFEGYNNDMQANSYRKISWLKSLKDRILPKQEWSDEDYNKIETIACQLDNTGYEDLAEVLRNIRDKYYHSIPQSTWKPSDEQMWALSTLANIPESASDTCKKTAQELLEQLKKLRDE